jgi:hypothetical protein
VSIVRSGSKFRDTGSRAILPMLSLTGYPPPPLIGRRGGKQTDLEHVWILSKHRNGVVVQSKIARAYTLGSISELQCSAPTDESYQPDYSMMETQIRYVPDRNHEYATSTEQQHGLLASWGCYLGLTTTGDHVVLIKPRSSCSARDIRKAKQPICTLAICDEYMCVSACVCILTSSSISFSGVNSLVTSKYSNRSCKASRCFNHPTSTRRESEALRKFTIGVRPQK